jgi:hypothetical protein
MVPTTGGMKYMASSIRFGVKLQPSTLHPRLLLADKWTT